VYSCKSFDKAGNVQIASFTPAKQQEKGIISSGLWFRGLAPLMLAALVKVIQFIPW